MEIIGYVATDKNGKSYLYVGERPPSKYERGGVWQVRSGFDRYVEIYPNEVNENFPTWEDEPIIVTIRVTMS